jgi:hypothetical protein
VLSWLERESTQVQFAVGFKIHGKTGHVVVDAEDALIAALNLYRGAYGMEREAAVKLMREPSPIAQELRPTPQRL